MTLRIQMLKRIALQVCLLTLVTTAAVIRQDDDKSDVARVVNNVEPMVNMTCLCIADGICEPGTTTCRLTHPDHRCYQSWAAEASDHSIHLTAGYVRGKRLSVSSHATVSRCIYNEYPIMRMLCAANDTSRVIVCCSHLDYCNDLDAYSKEIRHTLLASIRTGICLCARA